MDGLPLAIELAAARLRLVSPARLVDMLSHPLAALGGRGRDARQTLRATIEWSVALLDPPDRERFAALGVFPGSFDLSGAAAVLGLDAVDLLDSFDSLLDHHLIRPAVAPGSGDPRFQLLDALREYAVEHLAANGAETRMRWALARWCVALADETEANVTGPKSAEALDSLELEYASVNAVLGWLADRAPADPGALELLLHLCDSLWQFWSLRGRALEGAAWIDRAIDSADDRPSRALARAWLAAGQLAERRSGLATSEAAFTKAAEVSEEIGDDISAAEAWNGIGMVARTMGDPKRAQQYHERARAVFMALGMRRQEATSLNNLAAIAYFQDDPSAAARMWTTTLDLLREVGDERAVGMIVGNLGVVQVVLGDLRAAEASFDEAIEIAEKFGDTYGALTALVNSIDARLFSGRLDDVDDRLDRARRLATEADRYALMMLTHHEGRLAARRGDLGAAAALLAAGWHQLIEAEVRTEQASSLEYLGMVMAEVGDHAAAATVLEVAAHLRRSQTSDPLGPDAATLAQWTEVVERALGRPLDTGDDRADPVDVDVAALSAVIDAFVVAARESTRGDVSPATVWVQRYGLTPREAEIAGLLLERRTDQEIADALVVSRRTVTTHVSAVLRKLGITTRRDVAAALSAKD